MKKTICESCGMPMEEEYLGSELDGSKNKEYCKFCYQKGKFTDEGISMVEKINKNIEISKKRGIPEEKAKNLAKAIIPKLKRWKQ
jgi:hypothetical protein